MGRAVESLNAPARMKGKEYRKRLHRLQTELCRLQEWVKYRGLKVVIVFEGRDGAGKGGVIKAITERVSPRVFRVVALPAPSDIQKTQMYSQRYIPHLPAAGQVVIFDRSWYNRAGVEYVLGFCTPRERERFLRVVPSFERLMIENGIILLKYWLEVSNEEQARRFQARIDDPLRHWKLSKTDLPSREKWFEYSRARDRMFEASDTEECPWYIVHSDDKERARLNCIHHLLAQIPYQKVPRQKVKLPDRSTKRAYDDRAALSGRRLVPERY
jgi:polyphosphate kinase